MNISFDMAPECFESERFGRSRSGCMSPDSLREQTYANFCNERACDTFVELELYCDPLRNDIYLLDLVSNPMSMPVTTSPSRIAAYEHMPPAANFEATPRINSYRSAVYSTSPVALYEDQPSCATFNSSKAAVYEFADAEGPEGFEAIRNLTREAVYATLPHMYTVSAANPHPLRGAVYSSLPTTPTALTPPATPSPKLSKKHTYAMLNAQRAASTSTSSLPSVSAAESSLARHAVYAAAQANTDEVEDPPLSPTSSANRARSATFSVNNTINSAISGRAMIAMPQAARVPISTGGVAPAPTSPVMQRMRGVSTSARHNMLSPVATAPLPHSKPGTIGSMSMESITPVTAYTSKTRTPSMVRTGSSGKNLYALGSTSSLLNSMIDESSASAGMEAGGVPTVATPPRVKLTRVGHLGTIHQLQKFAC